MKQIVDIILKSPEGKTSIFIISVIISGILCSAFVTEISNENGIQWNKCIYTTTFWLLLIYSVFIYLYNRFLYNHERNILQFLDDNYCRAYIRKECLPELVEKYKTGLKEGKHPYELIDIMNEINKF